MMPTFLRAYFNRSRVEAISGLYARHTVERFRRQTFDIARTRVHRAPYQPQLTDYLPVDPRPRYIASFHDDLQQLKLIGGN